MSSSKNKAKTPSIGLRWWSIYALIIAATGLASIYFLLTQLHPSPLSETLLAFLIFMSASAFLVPISAYFNHRFAAKTWRKRDQHRLSRQALEAGILALVLLYLQRLQTLDWAIFGVLFGVFILMETFFITRT